MAILSEHNNNHHSIPFTISSIEMDLLMATVSHSPLSLVNVKLSSDS
jgi:hypothetical protein